MHRSIIQGLSNHLASIIHILPVPPLLSFFILSDPPWPSILERRFASHLISSHLISSHLILLSYGLFRPDIYGLSHHLHFTSSTLSSLNLTSLNFPSFHLSLIFHRPASMSMIVLSPPLPPSPPTPMHWCSWSTPHLTSHNLISSYHTSFRLTTHYITSPRFTQSQPFSYCK